MAPRENNEFLKRLQNGGNVVVAEGYIVEFERRGYLTAGTFVPEVILEHPELVRQMYEEFIHAGSDVVLALTYYAHREKLRLIGREDDLEEMNTSALKMAREVADKHGCLMAGNICNSTVFSPNDPSLHGEVEQMFKEQIELAVQYGADYIVGETYGCYGEARLALDCIKKYGNGLPAVVTKLVDLVDGVGVVECCKRLEETGTDVVGLNCLPAVVTISPPVGKLVDGVGVVECCKRLEEAGADVVGLNCGRGPVTMLPLLKEIKQVCKGPIAAVPVPYRTTPEEPTFFSLKVPGTGSRALPLDLCTCVCSRTQIAEFASACRELGIEYVGLCCGNAPNMTRIVAETYGRTPPASKYALQMDKHYIFGDKSKFRAVFTEEERTNIGGNFD